MVLKDLRVTNIPKEMIKYLEAYSPLRKKSSKLLKRLRAIGYGIMTVLFLLLFNIQDGELEHQILIKALLIAVLSTGVCWWKEICSILAGLSVKRLKKQMPEYCRQSDMASILNNLFILRKKTYIDKNCTVIRELFLFSDAKLKLYIKWKNQKGIFMEKTYVFELDRFLISEREAVPVYDVMNNYLRIPASYYIDSIIGRKNKK